MNRANFLNDKEIFDILCESDLEEEYNESVSTININNGSDVIEIDIAKDATPHLDRETSLDDDANELISNLEATEPTIIAEGSQNDILLDENIIIEFVDEMQYAIHQKV